MKQILIDGDILVYRAGFATNEEPVSHALQAVKMMLNNIKAKPLIMHSLEQCYYKIYLTSTDKSNFRYDIAKTKEYKGNRKDNKPKHYDALREYLITYHQAEVIHGMEADDALSIAQMNRHLETSIIVTIDKDLDQTPGWHYNFVKDKLYYISRRRAYQTFCEAMLIGDPVDNIRGYEGAGPVKAKAIMKACRGDKAKMIQTVYDLYTTKYDEDYFMEMGGLLWILREENRGWEPDLKTLRENKSDLHMVGKAALKNISRARSKGKDTRSGMKPKR